VEKHTAYESWPSDGILQKEQECSKTHLLLAAFVIGNANIGSSYKIHTSAIVYSSVLREKVIHT